MSQKNVGSAFDDSRVGMSMSEIRRLVVATFMGGLARYRRPKAVFTWGRPGEGKTFTMFAAARELSRMLEQPVKVYDVPTSCLEPTDVSGVPWAVKVNGDETYCRYLGMDWAWECSKEYEEWMKVELNDPTWIAPPALLFFDDLVAAHFQTQSAFFKGVQEGKWGSLHQRDNVMVIGCGNRVEDNAAANDMPTALANRFRHTYARPTTDDWLAWASDFREEGEEGVAGETRIHPLVIGFIRKAKDALREFDSDVATRSDKAFASCRTWEDISEIFYEGQITQDNKIFGRTVMGIVGVATGTQFLGYLRESTALIAPDDIVKDPENAPVPSRKNIDALHATIASLEAHIKQNPMDWEAGLIYSMRDEMLREIGLILAQSISTVIQEKLDPKEQAKAMGSDIFMKMFDRYEDIIEMGCLD